MLRSTVPGFEQCDNEAAVNETTLAKWEQDYASQNKGQPLYDFFPTVASRLSKSFLRLTWRLMAYVTGHGRCFNAWLKKTGRRSEECICSSALGNREESARHILFECTLYRELREPLLNGTPVGCDWPQFARHLVSSKERCQLFLNFRAKALDLRKRKGVRSLFRSRFVKSRTLQTSSSI